MCNLAPAEAMTNKTNHPLAAKEARRRLPIGAEVVESGVHFRVWAPAAKSVAVCFAEQSEWANAVQVDLEPEAGGYFSGHADEASAGMKYQFLLPRGKFPDPASRFQPEGPHGASEITDPEAFQWDDGEWPGVTRQGQIIYELHIGTFTSEGTWAAATDRLPHLASLGVTLLELMPVADFPGRFGWGYDGVNLFAPSHLYGRPDDFRRFVNEAHRLGLGVLLDVVYNHFGPDGNFLKEFAPHYFSERNRNEWGEAINFDNEHAGPSREFFVANAGYWIDEFHLDGLRIDATQFIFDASEGHVLLALQRRVREAARGRGTFIVGENEPQDARLLRTEGRGGYGLDALWNDDFHHSAIVALTGKNEAYYSDYRGSPQEFISLAKRGFLYQGQRYKWQKARRGSPALDLHPEQFVTFIQNHDQIANSLWGKRIHTFASEGRMRAMTALLLLGPGTPMLFQGQEFAASTPFLYFADHHPDLAALVAKGRAKFLSQFPSFASSPENADLLPRPELEDTFHRSKLDFAESERNEAALALHRDLIALRKSEPAIVRPQPGNLDGAVLGPSAFVLRYFGTNHDDRLLVVNLGQRLELNPAPEPLLAPVDAESWRMLWSSEDPRYGGAGTPALETDANWNIPAEAAVWLGPGLANHD